jgi:hypothetical protein
MLDAAEPYGGPAHKTSAVWEVAMLNLNEGDREVLAEILENDLAELNVEIAHTDNRDFRKGLVARREALERILSEVKACV